MKHPLRAAALAAGALLCFSASRAFADLQFVEFIDGDSFQAVMSEFGHGTINNLKAKIAADSPNVFIDESGGGGDPAFLEVSSHGWSQTSLNGPGTFLKAGGTAFAPTAGTPLSFALNFTGSPDATGFHDPNGGATSTFPYDWDFGDPLNGGTHFFIEFYHGSSFKIGYEVYAFRYVDTAGQTEDYFHAATYHAPVVPLPAAVWSGLAMLGLGGVFVVRRRRTRLTLN
jgi:LPXTG-motif cell wall-anchored protein